MAGNIKTWNFGIGVLQQFWHYCMSLILKVKKSLHPSAHAPLMPLIFMITANKLSKNLKKLSDILIIVNCWFITGWILDMPSRISGQRSGCQKAGSLVIHWFSQICFTYVHYTNLQYKKRPETFLYCKRKCVFVFYCLIWGTDMSLWKV